MTLNGGYPSLSETTVFLEHHPLTRLFLDQQYCSDMNAPFGRVLHQIEILFDAIGRKSSKARSLFRCEYRVIRVIGSWLSIFRHYCPQFQQV